VYIYMCHSRNAAKEKYNCHISRSTCLLKHVIEGMIEGRIEVKGRQGRKRTQLLCDLKDRRGYCKFKEEVIARSLWSNGFEETADMSQDRLRNKTEIYGRRLLPSLCIPDSDYLPLSLVMWRQWRGDSNS
jgi:hypothetical protein